MRFSIVSSGDFATATVFTSGGEILTADSMNPNWGSIVDALTNGDESNIVSLFNPGITAANKFESLSERVSIQNGHVFFDGDLVDNTLTQQIVRFLQEGVDDWKPLVAYMEKVYQNPIDHSREQLFNFIRANGITITEDGDLVLYKGVRDDLTSVSAGPALVNGEAVNGHVPNQPGNVIEMQRSKVVHDPEVACSTGLHVGAWEYASTFGTVTLECHVNPRDVVSVPIDHSAQKVRTCRYKVVGVVNRPVDTAVRYNDDDDYDYDYSYAGGY